MARARTSCGTAATIVASSSSSFFFGTTTGGAPGPSGARSGITAVGLVSGCWRRGGGIAMTFAGAAAMGGGAIGGKPGLLPGDEGCGGGIGRERFGFEPGGGGALNGSGFGAEPGGGAGPGESGLDWRTADEGSDIGNANALID